MSETEEEEIKQIRRQIEVLSNPFKHKSEVKERIDFPEPIFIEGDEEEKFEGEKTEEDLT